MVSVCVHPTHCWVGTPEQSMINVISTCTERAPIRTGKVKARGMALCVQCIRSIFHEVYLLFKGNLWIFPEGVADCLVCKLRGRVVGLIVRVVCGWGGIVKLLPSLVVVARGVSRAKLVFLVHVSFKFVTQVGEVVYWERVGAVPDIIMCGNL